MREKRMYPNKTEELEKHFRRVRDELIQEYELDFESAKQMLEMQSKESELAIKPYREVFRELALDLKKMEELDKAEDKNLEVFLSRIRPKFTETEVDLEQRQRDRVVRSHFYNSFQVIQPACIGADLLTSAAENLANVSGASGSGNPGVWFNNPNDVKDVKVNFSGNWMSSSCGSAVGAGLKSVIWQYVFTPNYSGLHWFLGNLPYHGFYVLRSNDTFWLCKYAKVEVSAYMDVYQYFWHGKRKCPIFSRYKENTNEADFIVGSAPWDFYMYLAAGDPAFIKIGLDLVAVAKGGGSYAEVNFDTGVANDVGPPMLVVG